MLAALALMLFAPRFAWAQGPLTPPGAPAPTFKTLQQVEPRTAITNAMAVTISASGSYYLTANITVVTGDAITITANGITLDLNGFTISTTAGGASGRGILMAGGNADITILNGHIRGGITNSAGVYAGGGFESGIEYINSLPSNVRVAGVSVRGCLYNGIHLSNGNSTVVESCTVQNIGGYGIWAASVTHSAAYECGSAAIYADAASDCSGYATGGGYGFQAYAINNSYGYSVNGTGIGATMANNCYGVSGGNGDGLLTTIAIGCYGYSGGNGVGLEATTAGNSYGYCAGGREGLFAATANNCFGQSSSGIGLNALTANNCHGVSSTSFGLDAWIAIGCYGSSTESYGLSGDIANSCAGSSVHGTSISPTTARYNMR